MGVSIPRSERRINLSLTLRCMQLVKRVWLERSKRVHERKRLVIDMQKPILVGGGINQKNPANITFGKAAQYTKN